jgi:CheY-like chemotaxis protein
VAFAFACACARCAAAIANNINALAQVTTATDGLEGLTQLQASVSGAPGAPPPPSFVLTDMSMPRLTGDQMARQFREWCAAAALPSAAPGLFAAADAASALRRERATQPAGQRRMYIVALSANVLECHAEACAAAGIDAFLCKPLRPEAVAQLWQMASAHGGCSVAAAAAAHFAAPP